LLNYTNGQDSVIVLMYIGLTEDFTKITANMYVRSAAYNRRP